MNQEAAHQSLTASVTICGSKTDVPCYLALFQIYVLDKSRTYITDSYLKGIWQVLF